VGIPRDKGFDISTGFQIQSFIFKRDKNLLALASVAFSKE
jgi:hypothetical protein